MDMQHKEFSSDELILVRGFKSVQKFKIGDQVCLNSGGPTMLIVDNVGPNVLVSWREGSKVHEEALAPACIHRIVG